MMSSDHFHLYFLLSTSHPIHLHVYYKSPSQIRVFLFGFATY